MPEKHVEIKDTRFMEDVSSVRVLPDIDSVDANEMGKALYAIIRSMHSSLGSDAGHFFIKEIQSSLGEVYVSSMKDMGVDLGLMQLEREVEEWAKIITKKKE